MTTDKADIDVVERHKQLNAGADEAATAIQQMGDDVIRPPTKEEFRAVRIKIDWRLIPIMVSVYAIQYYDKSVLNQAALFGILDDLQLRQVVSAGPPVVYSTTRYSLVGVAFYFGYLVGVYPACLLAQKFPAGKVCAGLVFVWSVVEVLTVVCSTFAGLFTQRFFLGFCESGIAPAFVIACSQWYTPGEQAFRIALWWSSNGLVTIIGPFVSYGFGSIPSSTLRPWQSIYLWAGLLTTALSVVVFFLMPDDPTRAKKFLSDRERFVVIERVRQNNSGIVSHKYKMSHILEAVRDPHVWLLVTTMFCIVTNNAITGTFASIIISNLGFNTLQSLALQAPAGFFGMLVGIIPGIIIYRYNNYRLIIFSTLGTLSIVGSAMLYAVPKTQTGALLAGYYMNNFYVGAPNLLLTASSANFAGSSKKSIANAMIFVSYCCGSLAPLFFKAEDQYHSGFLAILICTSYAVVAAQILRLLYRFRNKYREATFGAANTDEAFSDKTDLQNTNFRYNY